MKKIIVVFAALMLTIGATAQKRGAYHVRPRTYVVVGGAYNPYFYSPFYNPYYYPYQPFYNNRPSRLDFEIADIKSDYRARIRDVKHDKSLSKEERKKQVRDLKVQQDKAIRDAEKNYYWRNR